MHGKKIAAVVVFLTCLVAVLTTLAVLVGGSSSPTRTTTVQLAAAPPAVIAVDGPDKDAKPDDPVVLTLKARTVATQLAVGAEKGTNDLNADKTGLPPLKGTGPVGPVAQLLPPFASDSMPGCRTRFLPTNWSHRAAGVKVATFDLHYTAGPDIPNSRADVDGLTTFGSNPSSAVSWQLNMDKDGNCDYNVPLRYKAWTIAGLNSASINIEVAGKGEPPYLRPGGYRELARIYLEIHRRYPVIGLHLAAYKNCVVLVAGVGTHWMGGPCSGGHIDIKPLGIVKVIATLKKYVAADSCSARCRQAKALRAKHERTHRRFRKNRCHDRGGKRQGGYCDRLRSRNRAVHRAARREHISLRGTYR